LQAREGGGLAAWLEIPLQQAVREVWGRLSLEKKARSN
jgi:hypothetical protein